ncbi:MAG: chemotaxis protein CheW [Cyanobacteria bacterium P01_F01_bin.150]
MSNDIYPEKNISLFPHNELIKEGISADSLDDSQKVFMSADTEIEENISHKDVHQFLRLRLFPDTTVLLSMENLSEVLTIPLEQVVPIPGMPPWVMGIYNLRGDVLWISDLSHFLDLLPWQQQVSCEATYTVVVINITEFKSDNDSPVSMQAHKIGLIIKNTEDVEWCNLNEIQESLASEINSDLNNFIRGYWLRGDGKMLAVLDEEMILLRMSGQQN